MYFSKWMLCLLVFALPGVVPGALAVAADAGGRSPVEQQVLDFERQRCDAVLRRDLRALGEMLTDDLTYVHASGIKQDKQQYLNYVAAGKVTFTSYDIANIAVRIEGDAAVTHGVFSYEIASAKPVRGSTFYTGVYLRTKGMWRLSAWEASPKSRE